MFLPLRDIGLLSQQCNFRSSFWGYVARTWDNRPYIRLHKYIAPMQSIARFDTIHEWILARSRPTWVDSCIPQIKFILVLEASFIRRFD